MSGTRDRALRPLDIIRRLKIAPDAVVADLGAGEGYFTGLLADEVPRGKVIATDVKPAALGIVLRRAAASGQRNVGTAQGAPDRCGLESASVDLAFLCQLDHHLEDRVSYFETVGMALRPGGRMAIVNYGQYHQFNVLAARTAGFDVTDEWWPSPEVCLMVCARRG